MNKDKLTYIFQNIALAYGIEVDLLDKISYGQAPNENFPLHVYTSTNTTPVEQPVWDFWKNDSIPFVFNANKKEEIITQTKGLVCINYDVLTPIFYLLSGEQEINAPKDVYGRFQWKDSLQCKHHFTTLPLVNYYMDILVKALSLAINQPFSFKENSVKIHLTHDIDEITSAWKHRIRLALEKKNYSQVVRYFLQEPLSPFKPWKNLEEIASLELELGYIPTFYFLPKTGFKDAIKNADYSLQNSYLKKAITYLKNVHVSIGLHGSYRTHDVEKSLLEDKENLEENIQYPISSNRFHWLQFDVVATPPLLEKATITSDSTLGFQEHIGFRNSCCTPFYLYNHQTQQATSVIEYPLAIMDCTFAFQKYMGISPAEAKKQTLALYETVKKFHGVLVLNFHNTFLCTYENEKWYKMYKEVIRELRN